jgi:hypothetical protein
VAKKPKMSSKEYAYSEGKVCPFCRTERVVALSSPYFDDSTLVLCAMQCKGCKKEWTDLFRLAGYYSS